MVTCPFDCDQTLWCKLTHIVCHIKFIISMETNYFGHKNYNILQQNMLHHNPNQVESQEHKQDMKYAKLVP